MAECFEGLNPTYIFLSSLTTKFSWVVVQECILQPGQAFLECEDLAQKPKAVIPSRRKRLPKTSLVKGILDG